MHSDSYDLMAKLVNTHLMGKQNIKILDVGSYDVNGNYKYIFSTDGPFPGRKTWSYQGLDIEAGPNVDIVTEDPYHWPVKNNYYDVVISGQCLEHTEAPWDWIKEVNRVCKAGGLAIIIAPWGWEEHRYPLDCWRIFPDGMRYLLSKVANFDVTECGKSEDNKYNQGDTWGVGVKRKISSKKSSNFITLIKSLYKGK